VVRAFLDVLVMGDRIIRDPRSRWQSSAPTSLVFTGDVVLDVEEPDHWLEGIAPALRAADLALGHLEVPHTHRGTELPGDVPAPGADPAHLPALARAGFDAVTLAGNHIADRGGEGIDDTLAALHRSGIATTGAGATLAQARDPAVLHCNGRDVAVLSYNCVGPEAAWASATRPGCAWLPVETADGSPVAPTSDLVRPAAAAQAMLREDIDAARRRAQLVVVALHKGIVHVPARLAPYERPLARLAVDAGADIVIGHHAHILRGIERIDGRPVFHGLGNGCVVTRALSPGQDHAARAAWVERRKQLFGFEPDPAYTFAPFHPEAVHGLLARVLWHADGRIEAGFLPVHVDPPGRPRLAHDEQAENVRGYVRHITATAGLPALRLQVRADMTVVA
jgi:poly-gamma-glutamate capsule biosynthesis protein CapA/YwtB (metallophosphatase superfamily)